VSSLASTPSFAQQTSAQPTRIICQTNSSINTRLLQLRSDAGDTFKPTLLTATDPQGQPFKEIISHQIVYSDDNLTIAFIAAVDSLNRFGIYKLELKSAIKASSSQIINLLNPKLRNYVNYSRDFNFSLFAYYKGNLLYPANENGKWRLLSLSKGSVIREWTHPVQLFNPTLGEQMITWTTVVPEGSHLYTYNLRKEAKDVIVFKDTVQVLGSNKDEITLVNFFNLDPNKRVLRVHTYSNGTTRIIYELDSSQALYNNFVSVGTNLIFTSEKTFVTNNQIQVSEAFLNVYDTAKKVVVQRIKYPQLLIDLMRKQSPLAIRLLHSPMFNQNEILFSLNEMGGVIKYEFKTTNWFYINYPVVENTCFNPSFTIVSGSRIQRH
tara:strand:+ start:31575 stop:32714 length:1140 start_codon:yes stop_codon:yes gene_type:complete